jgi:hypothetical protein
MRMRWPPRSTLTALGILAAVVVLLRLPSLFEPAWSADEGTYADVGRSLDLGSVLYREAWDNKPPGIYWLSAAVSLGHASVFRMQLLALGFVAGGAIVVWALARRLTSNRAGVVAAIVYLAYASLPVFSGDQLNTEQIAAVPAAAAMLVMAGRRWNMAPRRCLAAGGLLALAWLIDIRTAADLVAVAAVPIIVGTARSRRPHVAEWRAAGLVLGGWVAVLAVVAVPLAAGGSLPGFVDVLVKGDTGYLAYFQTQAAYGPGTAGSVEAAALVAGAARVAGALLVGGGLTLFLARRGSPRGAVAAWWVACDLAAVMLDARGFTHYAQLAAPSLAIAAAMVASVVLRRTTPLRAVAAFACLIAVWPVALAALYVPPATAALATGARLPAPQDPEAAQTPAYVTVGWERVLGLVTPGTFDRTYAGDLYPLDLVIAGVFLAHSDAGDPVFVWGGPGSPWAYALADRRPSARFVWMGSAYDTYPGAQAIAIADLVARPPAVLVAVQPLPARVQQMLRSDRYRPLAVRAPLTCWLAPWST